MRFVHWFRNDLRLRDNTALVSAAVRADELIPVFVFDPHLLGDLSGDAPRLRFLADSVRQLALDLERRGSRLVVRYGDPVAEIPRLLQQSRASVLTFNRDYTPYARRRDAAVATAARRVGVRPEDFKDRVVFESDEVRTRSGGAFRVYTPYRRAWLARFQLDPPIPARAPRLPPFPATLDPGKPVDIRLARAATGAVNLPAAGEAAARRRLRRFLDKGLRDYGPQRDLPAADGTSRLSPYLRFGALSARQCIHEALRRAVEPDEVTGAHRWLDELVWREFYCALLADEPRLLHEPWRLEYASVQWDDDEPSFAAWCAGRTGYPFVDAAMRQLMQTGWMHNRARMVAASFLVKDLLIDWRRGEDLFMQRLVDGDPASNSGGWQWVASTGTDAQPYFRVFNPVAQGERFDPEGAYVRRYVPELSKLADRFVHRPWEADSAPRDYPPPIVVHERQRRIALERFRAARSRARKT